MKGWSLGMGILVCLFCTPCTQVKTTQNDGGNLSEPNNTSNTSADGATVLIEHNQFDEPAIDSPGIPEKSTLWGNHNLVDVHAHIGTFRGYDLSTPTLMSNIQGYGVSLALISNIDGANLPGATRNLSEEQANQATVDVVRAYPLQLRGIAWTRPNDGQPKFVEPFLRLTLTPNNKQPVFVGLKFHPEMNQFPADSNKIDGYMKLCETYKRAAVFHNGGPGSNSSPELIYKAAKRFPTVPVVLYHMGFGGSHQASIQVVKQSLQNKDAQLYLGTAQADPQAVLQAIREVGSSRVMFGTDATYYGTQHYDNYKPMIELLRKQLSDTDFFRVVRDNARQIFQLP